MTRKPNAGFLLLFSGLSLFLIALAWVVGFLITTPPRGFLFWTTEEFLSFFVVVSCLLALNVAARAKSDYRPSGATIMIVGGVVAIDVIVSLISLAVYAMGPHTNAQSDLYMAAWLVVVNGIAFVVAAFLYGFDITQRVHEAPAIKAREAYKVDGRQLAAAVDRLGRLAKDRASCQAKIDSLMKQLRAMELSISHASGGGLGSWEGHGAIDNRTLVVDIEAGTARISDAVNAFAASPDSLWNDKLAEVENSVAALQTITVPLQTS